MLSAVARMVERSPDRGSGASIAGAALATAVLLAAPAAGVECEIGPVADTTLLSHAPANPQGRLAFLRLGSPAPGARSAVLARFDALERCPGLAGASVEDVALVVSRSTCSPTTATTLPLSGRAPRKAWSEATATWNSHGPDADAALFPTAVDCAVAEPTIVAPALTSLVRQWADGSRAELGISLLAQAVDGWSMAVRSREDANGPAPRLRMRYTPVVSPCPDSDGDGWAACTKTCDATGSTCGDCDDASTAVHPGAAERCDGVDNDCEPGTVEHGCATCDLDGNGYGDILWRNSQTGAVGAWLMDHAALAGWAWLPAEPSQGWQIRGCADFGGAGDAHVVWRNVGSGANGTWRLAGTSIEGWLPWPSEPPSSGWEIRGVGEFGGAIGPEVLWRNAMTGHVGVWRMEGPTVVGWTALPTESPTSGWAIQGAGDFDRDGDADVLWRNTSTGQVGAWRMEGTTVAGWAALPTEPPQSGWQIRAILDLDGDGGADVVWRNAASGAVGAWIMDGTAVSYWVPIAVEAPSSGWEIVAPR